MKPCPACGGLVLKVDAVYEATDTIEVSEDGSGDFECIDTTHGDGEWKDQALVRCAACYHALPLTDWPQS